MSEKYVSLEWSFIRDKNTTMQEKLIYSEISQLQILERGCVARNGHFAKLLGVKKTSVSRSISSLEKKGYITTVIKDGSRNHDRKITINKMLSTDNKMLSTPLTNCLETKETNTNYNNTVNKKKRKSPTKKLDLSEIDPPKNLNITAWQLWMDYKKHKKPYTTEQGVKTAMKQLASIPYENQKACIENSVGNEYQGFFTDKFTGKNNGNNTQRPETTGERINREVNEAINMVMGDDESEIPEFMDRAKHVKLLR